MGKIPILRVFDENGNEIPIPAIQGRKGDKGDKGDPGGGGDMFSSVYDPTGKKENVFAYVDNNAAPKDHGHTAEEIGAIPDTWLPTLEEIGGAAKIKTGSYVGTGKSGSSNKNTLTFDFDVKYLCVTLREDDNFAEPCHAVILPDAGYGIFNTSEDLGGGTDVIGMTSRPLSVTKNGNTVSWYVSSTTDARRQFNSSGFTYHYVAIG